MSLRPIVGITCTTHSVADQSVWTDQLKHAYARAVWNAGGMPVLMPNVADPAAARLADRMDGLLLSGGRDLEPSLYGDAETHPTVELDRPRDAFELPLTRRAFEINMPILGICRGIQTLNVALGGTLWQDVPSQWRGTSERDGGPLTHRQEEPGSQATHGLRMAAGSVLRAALGVAEFAVNTFHHQAVRDVADPLRAVGWSEDGLIEAVEAPDRAFVIGVQYHPEEMADTCAISARLFAAFVEACATFRKER